MRKVKLPRKNPNNPIIKAYGEAVRKGEAVERVMREFKRKYKDYLESAYEEIPDRNLGDEMVSDLKTSLNEIWNLAYLEGRQKGRKDMADVYNSRKVICVKKIIDNSDYKGKPPR